jgi:hypothetical protein
MVSDKRRLVLVTVAAAAALAFAVMRWQSSGSPSAGPLLAASGERAGDSIPWIDLDRAQPSDEAPPLLGQKRNIFAFGVDPPPDPPPFESEAGGPGGGGGEEPPLTPTPTAPPDPPEPMLIKFIGLLTQEGTKIAVLMSEQKEVLHGKEGDVLAGRYRIVKIGLESVDMEDVTTGQSQRIALRGN